MAGIFEVFLCLDDSYLWCYERQGHKRDLLTSYGKSPPAFLWVSVEVQQKRNEVNFKHCLQQNTLLSCLNRAGEGSGMDH